MKEELSTLVNANLWISLSQEVRAKEKALNISINDRKVKNDIKQLDMNALLNTIHESKAKLSSLKEELEILQKKQIQQQKEILQNSTSRIIEIIGTPIEGNPELSIDNEIGIIEKDIQNLDKQKGRFQSESIEPLRRELDYVIQRMTKSKPINRFNSTYQNISRTSEDSEISQQLEILKGQLSYQLGMKKRCEGRSEGENRRRKEGRKGLLTLCGLWKCPE